MDVVQLTIDLLTALGALAAGVGTIVLNNKFDRLQGKVETLETGFDAHVNAPGLQEAEPSPDRAVSPPDSGNDGARLQPVNRPPPRPPGELADSDRCPASGAASASRQRRCIQRYSSGRRRT